MQNIHVNPEDLLKHLLGDSFPSDAAIRNEALKYEPKFQGQFERGAFFFKSLLLDIDPIKVMEQAQCIPGKFMPRMNPTNCGDTIIKLTVELIREATEDINKPNIRAIITPHDIKVICANENSFVINDNGIFRILSNNTDLGYTKFGAIFYERGFSTDKPLTVYTYTDKVIPEQINILKTSVIECEYLKWSLPPHERPLAYKAIKELNFIPKP